MCTLDCHNVARARSLGLALARSAHFTHQIIGLLRNIMRPIPVPHSSSLWDDASSIMKSVKRNQFS